MAWLARRTCNGARNPGIANHSVGRRRRVRSSYRRGHASHCVPCKDSASRHGHPGTRVCGVMSAAHGRGDGRPDVAIARSGVMERHPELGKGGVVSAWANQCGFAIRETDAGWPSPCRGGTRRGGRELEMVAVELAAGDWLVCHAMTPPSTSTKMRCQAQPSQPTEWNRRPLGTMRPRILCCPLS